MIRNILKNGTEVADLTGYIVRESEAPEAYGVIRKREREMKRKNRKNRILKTITAAAVIAGMISACCLDSKSDIPMVVLGICVGWLWIFCKANCE